MKGNQTHPVNGEASLWASVIAQAIADATARTLTLKGHGTTPAEHASARAWFKGAGPDFRAACALAGLEWEAVHDHALDAIERAGEPDPIIVPKRTGRPKAEKPAKLPKAPKPPRPAKPKPERQRRILYTFNGQTMTLVEWSKALGIKQQTIWARIRKGWTIEDVLSRPNRLVPNTSPGAAENFPKAQGTGGGPFAQDHA